MEILILKDRVKKYQINKPERKGKMETCEVCGVWHLKIKWQIIRNNKRQ